MTHSRLTSNGLFRIRTSGIILVACLWLLACLGINAYADETEDAEVLVDVPFCLLVEYTGDSRLVFDVDCDDIERGSKKLNNQGNVVVSTNVHPWEIRVTRSDWEQTSGHHHWPGPPTRDIWLDVRYGSGHNGWYKVETYPRSQAWISGTSKGTFNYNGVDWRIRKIGEHDHLPYGHLPPGTYECTVTFTISSAGD